MNTKFIFLFVFVFLSIVNVSAEMSFWTDTLISNSSQTINYHGFYKFEDTSVDGIGRHIPIEIYLSYQVQALPFPSGVDYCNFTILHLKNRYDSLGNFQNISRETQNYFFTTGALNYSTIIIEAYDRDSIIYDMVCHYEGLDNFTSYAYKEMNTPIGSVTTFFPSYYCKECSDYTLEELSQETTKNEAMIEDEINIYDNIQKIVVQNYKLWLITNWISKFGLLFASIILIFAGVYYIYEFIKDLAK